MRCTAFIKQAPSSVIVPRHPHARDIFLGIRAAQGHALVEGVNHRAEILLPWGLAVWNWKATRSHGASRHALNSSCEIRMFALHSFNSIRIMSPVCRTANPPLSGASGAAFKMDGEPDVPIGTHHQCTAALRRLPSKDTQARAYLQLPRLPNSPLDLRRASRECNPHRPFPQDHQCGGVNLLARQKPLRDPQTRSDRLACLGRFRGMQG